MSLHSIESILPVSLTTVERQRVMDVAGELKLWIGNGLVRRAAELFKALEWPINTTLICDNNTWEVLAKDLAAALTQAGWQITLINLGSAPKPTDKICTYVQQASLAAGAEALIAVGSGTINDIVKYTAAQMKKPYVICGTAPSMNGYLSANAAIILEGHKKSVHAALPKAALLDSEILQKAPDRLLVSGVGDVLCRATVQVDWLLSHRMLGTAYDALPFKLLATAEAALMQGDLKSLKGDIFTITHLLNALLLSGLGMVLAQGSYPASQGEHLIAHYMEMQHPGTTAAHYHGEHIAVTSRYMAHLQGRILASESPPLWEAECASERECFDVFPEATAAHVWREYQKKCDALGSMNGWNERMVELWPSLRTELQAVRVKEGDLCDALERYNAPTEPTHIGWSDAQIIEAMRNAPLIRNRFTFLDLAALGGYSLPR